MLSSPSAADKELLRGLPNPFEQDTVHNPWAVDPSRVPDVGSVHGGTEQAIFQELLRVRQEKQQRNVFIWGEAGSGKTHLVARVLRQVRDTMDNAVSCYVLMPESVRDRFWTYLRGCLVKDLLTPLGDRRTGLDRLLRARLPDFAGAAADKGGPFLVDVMKLFRRESKPVEKLDRLLRSKLELDGRVARAIAQLSGENQEDRDSARDWLAGKDLTPEQLTRLELPTVALSDQGKEEQSRDVVLALYRLTSDKVPLLVFFDQLEAFRDYPGDLHGFHKFGKYVVHVKAETPVCLLQVTFARTDRMQEIKGGIDEAQWVRVAERQLALAPLSWEQSTQVVLTRMNAIPDLHRLRQGRLSETNNASWPFTRARLDALYSAMKHNCTPRRLLQTCREDFERVRELVRPDPSLADFLRTKLLQRRAEKKTQTAQDRLAQVVAGLPLLTELLQLSCTPLDDAALRLALPDAHLVVRDEQERLVFGACAAHPHVWQRFKRWHKHWDAHLSRKDRCQQLLIVSDASPEQYKPATQEWLSGLCKLNGVRLVLPSEEQIATFNVLQGLTKDAESGNLSFNGLTVERQHVCDWARASIGEPGHPLGVLRLLADDLGFDLSAKPPVTPSATPQGMAASG